MGHMEQILLYRRQLPWPTNWAEIFGREAPLIVEIGFGGGHFLIDLAQKRPFANVLGVEISIPSIRRAVQKTKVAQLDNVRVMQTDAQFLLWALCQTATIQHVFINFPDPWPKAGHNHRRLIQPDFLHLLASRLPPGGQLDIATDHADYALVITDCLEQTPYFDSRHSTTFVTEDTERLRTKYELTAMREGRTCHYYKWQRNAIPAENRYPVPQEYPMPHVILRCPLSIDDVEAQYERTRADRQDVHVKLVELFRSREEPKLLIEAYINESPLSQRVGLVIRQREGGEFIISVHEVGFPHVTPGIHLAVASLASWLLSLHPEAEVVNSNLTEPLPIS